MSPHATLDPVTRFFLAWAVPVILLWIGLYVTTLVHPGSRDSSVVWPYQIHLAAGLVVPALNAWVLYPRFRRKATAFLSGVAIPVIALAVLLAA
jgi:hypothetical protein